MDVDCEMSELDNVIINFESVELQASPSPTTTSFSAVRLPPSQSDHGADSRSENVFRFRRSLDCSRTRSNLPSRSQERYMKEVDLRPLESRKERILPAIGRLVSDSKFVATETRGEREMHMKLGLSRSCDDLRCLMNDAEIWNAPEKEPEVVNMSPDIAPACFSAPFKIHEKTPERMQTDHYRKSSVDSEYLALSPVGYFMSSSPTSPTGPMGRQRSGSQSPYRRTYNSHPGMQLRQSVLGKRRADEMEDEKVVVDKRPRSSTVSIAPLNSNNGE